MKLEISDAELNEFINVVIAFSGVPYIPAAEMSLLIPCCDGRTHSAIIFETLWCLGLITHDKYIELVNEICKKVKK